jgi:hypothetical protein
VDNKVKEGFSQIEYCGFTDKVGHDIKMNKGYIDVKETFGQMIGYLNDYKKDLIDFNDEQEEDYYLNNVIKIIEKAKTLINN